MLGIPGGIIGPYGPATPSNYVPPPNLARDHHWMVEVNGVELGPLPPIGANETYDQYHPRFSQWVVKQNLGLPLGPHTWTELRYRYTDTRWETVKEIMTFMGKAGAALFSLWCTATLVYTFNNYLRSFPTK
jgi:hypothetical protein